ncbi:hypothetical protein A0H81_14721 [Grifola frondosa]|uniref:Uncharacterized protein n=1 Tax=Grifola frondosa TaxID=5627 RepID=A0A1C7LM76_GRIFR|nr:hypothetical protein A0H81_14721 [Grifola frondosa]
MLPLLRSQVVLAFTAVVTAAVILVDDSDPRITYAGTWTFNPPPGNMIQYNDTVTLTRELGAAATFSFTGTAISVYGTRGPTGTYTWNATYSIDGGPPWFFADENPLDTQMYRVKFFASSLLPDAQHTLLITNIGDWYWLDYLAVNISDSTPDPNNSSSSILNPPSSSSDPSSVISQASSSFSAATTSTMPATRSGVSPGVVAGIAVAVAGAMLLMFLLVCCWWFRRRRVLIDPSHPSPEKTLQGSQTLPNIIQPYTMVLDTSPHHPTFADSPTPQLQSTPSGVFPTHVQATQIEMPNPHLPPAHKHKHTTAHEPNIPSVQSTSSDEVVQNQSLALSSPLLRSRDVPRGARQPRDGGVRIAGGPVDPDTYMFDSEGLSEQGSVLPPSYARY